MTGQRIKLKHIVTQASLIGVNTSTYPVGWGNYFWIDDDTPSGLRIVNFWSENLKEAARRYLKDDLVEVLVWRLADGTGWGLIDDPRIPDDWYYNKLCWTGYGRPDLDTAREMFAVRGDPDNELLQWTDAPEYWRQRGGVLHENGCVSFSIPSTLRKVPEFTFEVMPTLHEVDPDLFEALGDKPV